MKAQCFYVLFLKGVVVMIGSKAVNFLFLIERWARRKSEALFFGNDPKIISGQRCGLLFWGSMLRKDGDEQMQLRVAFAKEAAHEA